MQVPPALPWPRRGIPIPRTALLVNPFYPKDVNASFGKHVLTPTLALTSIAGATPPEWTVRYWDENLLQGPPPIDPLPQVVGITVHLTFARRAYELADWFKAHGCTVILGGLHALSCPDEVQAHGDAIAIGNGVPTWPRILRDIMFLLSDHGDTSDPVSRQIMTNIQSIYDQLPSNGRLRIVIRGANHFSFSDQMLLRSQLVMRLLQMIGRLGLEPRRGLAVSAEYVHRFFDVHLKGAPAALLQGPSPEYPELQFDTSGHSQQF